MDLESAQNNALAKLPLLKQEDGKSFKPVARTTTNADGTSTSTIPGAVTAEEKIQKKNDLKARSILMMTLPSEYLLTFNQYKVAKTLFEAIEARFGGNEATKKTQKALLKQITNDVNTSNVHVSTASSSLSTASTTDNTARLGDATIYAFLANQPNGSQVVHEDLEQIHEDDLEEMDLKCYDKTKVECFNCHKMGHFARECRNPRSQEYRSRNQDISRKTVNVEESSSKAMLAIDGVGFDWSFMTKEKIPINFTLMAFSDSEVHNNKTCSKTCLKIFEDLKSQYDNLRIELNKSEFDLANYKRGLASVEEQLVFYKKNEERLKKEKESNQIKIEVEFQFTPKACFVGGSFNHLIKDCDFHDKKMVQKPVLNNVKKGTGQREVRPVWNNDMRTNHQNFSNSRRNFAPTAVLTKSGLVPISTARQSSSRAATSVSTVRPIKTATPRSFVNVAKTRSNAFQKLHSPSRRPFYQQTALKNRNLNNKVNTVKVNSVNTAKGKRVTSVVGEQGINAVKSKACWVWRPKIKVLDHVSKNNGSYICKQFDYVDPTVLNQVGDEAVHKELGDRMERAATTASSFKTEQDSGGYTPGSDEGSKKLNELTELCTKLSEKVTSLEQDLKQTKQVYGKALTKLVKKVKHLEDQLKSTTKRRKAKVVISDEEEDLVSEDPSKQGRMSETEYEDVETEHAEEESSEVHLDVLSVAKILSFQKLHQKKKY
ncbi:putative ribonuclease H-like domain-containing protein [Tanacetum coccineum]